MGEKRGMQALEHWCRKVTAGYKNVNVTNMTSSWRDGLAFCALIHHFRPDLIDFASLSPENVYDNNQLAFSVAEQQLGIPALLDPEDMVKCSVPDRLSILTYLSQFFQVLAAPKSKGDSPTTCAKRPAPGDSPVRDCSPSPAGTPVKVFARQLQERSSPSPRRQDSCVVCHNAVFIAERLMVHGRLHHRTCFKCARCTSQLSLANYYETEQGQYCCETCPDEANAAAPSANSAVELIPDAPSVRKEEEKEELPPPSVVHHSSAIDNVVKTSGSQVVALQRHFMDAMISADAEAEAGDDESSPVVNEIVDEENVDEKSEMSQICGDVPEPPSDPHPPGSPVCNESVEIENAAQIETEDANNPFGDDDEEEESEDVPETVDVLHKSQDPDVVEEEPEEVEKEPEEVLKDEEPTENVAEEQIKAEETVESVSILSIPSEDPVIRQPEAPLEADDPEIVPSKPTRRKSKRNSSGTSSSRSQVKTPELSYPEELNPFDDDPDPVAQTPKKLIPAPKISLNPFGSDDEDEDETISDPPPKPIRPAPPKSLPPSAMTTPSPKKRLAPPPPVSLEKSLSNSSTPVSLRRKNVPAPPPPILDGSTASANSLSPIPAPRTILTTPPSPLSKSRLSTGSMKSEKDHKDLSNLHKQCSVSKDSHGQWKRKKGPAPPRPSPQKRQLRKLPLKVIQQELEDIEVKQLELERQGVDLEQSIRSLTEPEDGSVPIDATVSGIHVEELILQLFDLVNEKNDLLRRQTELMYTRRQQRLEEEHAELEFQIRCLMEKPGGEKTDEDRLREEELIQRLVQVVHRRAEVVDCLEMDRRRQMEEDLSIQQHLDVFNSRGAPSAAAASGEDPILPKSKSKGLKMIQSPMKLIKKEKKEKSKKSKKKVDADKDVDESVNEDSPPKEKDKTKTRSSWFAKKAGPAT